MRSTWKSLLVFIPAMFLAACGGGGGGDDGPATQAPTLESVATLNYQASNLSGVAYDPWTPMHLEPVLTGVPAGAAKTFRVGNLPAGLAFDPGTGVISGFAESPQMVTTSAMVTVSVQGYRGEISTTPKIWIHGLSWFASFGAGFTFDDRVQPTLTGTVGVPGTVHASAVMDTVLPQGGAVIADPLPTGATVVYGLAPASNVPGGGIDPATGLWSWTPDRTGTFVFQWYADVTYKGVTRRVTSPSYRVVIV